MSPLWIYIDPLWFVGVMLFVLIWIVFVPIIVTRRLEKIIQLLEKK